MAAIEVKYALTSVTDALRARYRVSISGSDSADIVPDTELMVASCKLQ